MKKYLRWTTLFLPVFVVLYALCFFFLDKQAAYWAKGLEGTILYHLADIVSLIGYPEYWFIVLAALIIMIGIHDYQHGQTERTRILLTYFIAMTVAIIIGQAFKFTLARYRPILLLNSQLYGFSFFSSEWVRNSTPSGHTYCIFSAATSLALSLKRYYLPLFTLAAIVGISRIVLHDHYPSDVLFGAYIGLLSAVTVRYFMYEE